MHVGLEPTGEVRGGARSILAAALNLRRYRPVFAVSHGGDYAEELWAAGMEVHVLPTWSHVEGIRDAPLTGKLARLRSMAGHAAQVVRLAKRTLAAIVHCQYPKDAVVIGPALRLPGIPLVCHVRHQSLNRNPWLFVAAAAASTRMVHVSERVRDEWLSFAPSALHDWIAVRSCTVASGIDMDGVVRERRRWGRVEARRSLDLGTDAFVVSLIGPLERTKNQLAFLERAGASLLALSPRLRLVLLGSDRRDPEYAARVRGLAAALGGSERVMLLPERPHREMAPVYVASDVVAIPSVLEGLPRVALEAQAFGCPVVATRIPGVLSAVEEGRSAVVVSPERLEDFADAVAVLLEPSRRREFSLRAESHARKHFDVRERTEELEAVYDACLGHRDP